MWDVSLSLVCLFVCLALLLRLFSHSLCSPPTNTHPATSSLLSENFNASLLLLDKYAVFGFEDLKQGLEYLERQVQRRSAGTTSFIKEHVGSFIQCYDTVANIRSLSHTYS